MHLDISGQDTSYISFIVLFLTLIILLCFISVIMLLLLVLLYTNTFFFTHTLGCFWRPWIHTSMIFGHLLILFRCSWDRTLREELEFLSHWLYVFLLFYSCYFLILSLSHPVAIFFPLLIYYHCIDIYMSNCSDIDLS